MDMYCIYTGLNNEQHPIQHIIAFMENEIERTTNDYILEGQHSNHVEDYWDYYYIIDNMKDG